MSLQKMGGKTEVAEAQTLFSFWLTLGSRWISVFSPFLLWLGFISFSGTVLSNNTRSAGGKTQTHLQALPLFY